MPFEGNQALEIASEIGQSDLSLDALEAAGVYHGMDPCRQTTSGTTQVRIRPPFELAACWLMGTLKLSTICTLPS